MISSAKCKLCGTRQFPQSFLKFNFFIYKTEIIIILNLMECEQFNAVPAIVDNKYKSLIEKN